MEKGVLLRLPPEQALVGEKRDDSVEDDRRVVYGWSSSANQQLRLVRSIPLQTCADRSRDIFVHMHWLSTLLQNVFLAAVECPVESKWTANYW